MSINNLQQNKCFIQLYISIKNLIYVQNFI